MPHCSPTFSTCYYVLIVSLCCCCRSYDVFSLCSLSRWVLRDVTRSAIETTCCSLIKVEGGKHAVPASWQTDIMQRVPLQGTWTECPNSIVWCDCIERELPMLDGVDLWNEKFGDPCRNQDRRVRESLAIHLLLPHRRGCRLHSLLPRVLQRESRSPMMMSLKTYHDAMNLVWSYHDKRLKNLHST